MPLRASAPVSYTHLDVYKRQTLESKINVMRTLAVPYAPGYEKQALQDLTKQAEELTADLQKNGAPAQSNKEIIALIAYLQRMGTDIKGETNAVK